MFLSEALPVQQETPALLPATAKCSCCLECCLYKKGCPGGHVFLQFNFFLESLQCLVCESSFPSPREPDFLFRNRAPHASCRSSVSSPACHTLTTLRYSLSACLVYVNVVCCFLPSLCVCLCCIFVDLGTFLTSSVCVRVCDLLGRSRFCCYCLASFPTLDSVVSLAILSVCPALLSLRSLLTFLRICWAQRAHFLFSRGLEFAASRSAPLFRVVVLISEASPGADCVGHHHCCSSSRSGFSSPPTLRISTSPACNRYNSSTGPWSTSILSETLQI